MAIRQDKIQISLEFFTDESKAFAKTITDTQKFNSEVNKAQGEVNKLQKEFDKLTKAGKDTTDVELKLAEANKKVSTSFQEALNAGKSLAGLDLTKVIPAQLQQRLTQITQQLKAIPTSFTTQRSPLLAEQAAIQEALGRTKAKIGEVSNEMNRQRTESSSFFQQLFSVFAGGGLLNIVQNVIGGIVGLGKTAIQASADLESLKATVEIFLGAGSATTKFLNDIKKFAAETPFEFPELAEAGKKLLAFGYDGDEATKLLKRLGEVSAAAQIPIGELASIIGKAKLGQKIQGEELNQLADRGINIFPELARVLGTTEDKIKKLGSEGKIAYSDLEKAITLATDKGGKFFGLMEKQSQTFNGLISTLSDNFGQFVQSIFGGVSEGLKPVIKGVADFFGQLTDLITEGKKPVGEYAEVIQFAANVLRVLGNVFGIVWEAGKLLIGVFIEQVKVVASVSNRISDLIGWFVNLAAEAKKIPIIGTLFKPVLDAIGLVSDLLSNASATFAGFRAAAAQAVTNVQNYFRALIIDASILGEKIASALSFNNEIKAASAKNIAALEAQKSQMFNAGKTVEQAYTEGRNAAIAIQNKVEADGEVKRKAQKRAAAESDAKAAEKAEKERLDKIKKAQELELQAAEVFYGRQLLANEIAHFRKERNDSDFAELEAITSIEKYDALLKIQRNYLNTYKANSKEFFDAETKIFELERKRAEAVATIAPRNTLSDEQKQLIGKTPESLDKRTSIGVERSTTGNNLDKLKGEADAENLLLQSKFAQQVINEIEFENRKAEIRKEYADKALAEAIKNGEIESGQITKLNKEKIDADDFYQKTIRDNEKRTADLKAELEQVKLGLASQSLGLAIDLLSQDEQARKKNASAIKAFQIAQITVDGIQEVQAIWRNANSNPLNALIPGAGTAIALVQTALAVGRSGLAINKVQKQKFAGGGYTGFGGPRDETGYSVRGTVHEGEWVSPKWMVEHPTFAPAIQMLEMSRRRGYADGGFVNTTPSSNLNLGMTTQNVQFDMNGFAMQIQGLRDDMNAWNRDLRVSFYRTEYENLTAQDAADKKVATL